MANRNNGVTEYTWGGRRSRNKILLIVAGCLVIIGVAVAGFFYFGGEDPLIAITGSEDSGSDGMQARKLDGIVVDEEYADLFPVAVMVENMVSARPQSGLREAGVVYEALAEGGITRFMAVYATNEPISAIGPVRSARPYYLDWANEYGALYAHIGGSPQAIAEIKSKGIFDLNQFFNSQYFWRDTKRAAPHNLYTSSEKLVFAQRDTDAPTSGDYASWTFKDDAAIADRPTDEKTIEIDFSSFSYKVKYIYDRENNVYARTQAGEPHVDTAGKQITPKNVVVQFTVTSLADNEGRLSMKTTGEGRAIIFRDGIATEGRWKKDDSESRTVLLDADGKPIELNRGSTWIEIVPADRQITST